MHQSCLEVFDLKDLNGLRLLDVVYGALLLSIIPDPGGKNGKSQKDPCKRHKSEDFIVT